MAFECVLRAWHSHQTELYGFLIGQMKEPAMAEDVLQDVFFKAMREGENFCDLQDPRAWLFRVARNALTDSHRLREALALRCDVVLDGSGSVCCHAAIS
ncbi:hypothetical protein DIT71_00595 [Marinobacter vulgaris]|uniref:RNA polymerase sigma-70 region 2 domain-containing protein n=1 Tax=Marinobacter vulgaris TaxID=1928331 RepID=A0A2V3ZSW1_9GAMM|nr:RNA polymerase sigma factor [Marinobacter vulgaris]PXX93336.1 hypothetical protein DIT71_00595 [Marinobacter vulgaris]TSJ72652.1 RNA polymerase sigma factor [Marinobacter vulgaris]